MNQEYCMEFMSCLYRNIVLFKVFCYKMTALWAPFGIVISYWSCKLPINWQFQVKHVNADSGHKEAVITLTNSSVTPYGDKDLGQHWLR